MRPSEEPRGEQLGTPGAPGSDSGPTVKAVPSPLPPVSKKSFHGLQGHFEHNLLCK